MSRSAARLEARSCDGATRVTRAFASSPQRWTAASAARDGWTEVTHQLLGDGAFSGDASRVSIRVKTGAKLLVRGIAATPLRRGGASLAAVRVSVAPRGEFIYLPGPLVPHAGSNHSSSLHLELAEGARALVVQVLAPGRVAMGESAAFERLRIRTRAWFAGDCALWEDTDATPGVFDAPASLGDAGASLSALVLGDWPQIPAEVVAFSCPDTRVAASELRAGGFAVRGLFRTFGHAQTYAARLEGLARAPAAEAAVY